MYSLPSVLFTFLPCTPLPSYYFSSHLSPSISTCLLFQFLLLNYFILYFFNRYLRIFCLSSQLFSFVYSLFLIFLFFILHLFSAQPSPTSSFFPSLTFLAFSPIFCQPPPSLPFPSHLSSHRGQKFQITRAVESALQKW